MSAFGKINNLEVLGMLSDIRKALSDDITPCECGDNTVTSACARCDMISDSLNDVITLQQNFNIYS